MADTSGTAPKEFLVKKDNGEWWTVTYGGTKGVRWDRADPPIEHETPDEAHSYADSLPEDIKRAKEWSDFFAELLILALDEARPYIEVWLRDRALPWVKSTALPWMKTTAKSAWTRIIKKLSTQQESTQPVQVVTPSPIRITDVAPSNAIALSERADDHAQAHRLNLTPEEAQKQLEDIVLLTRILAAKLRGLTNAVIRKDGEANQRFLERRKQAELLAVRNVTSNIQVMLERGIDLGQAIDLLATYTPVFAAGSVEAASYSIEGPSQLQHPDQPRI